MGLALPEMFAGIVALNGRLPRQGRPLFRYPAVRGLHVLIGHGIANAVVPLSLAKSDHQLLWSAGLQVELRTYPATHRIHVAMLHDINRWIIQHINQEHDSFREE
jgi:phospholipase/carboxylesterase